MTAGWRPLVLALAWLPACFGEVGSMASDGQPASRNAGPDAGDSSSGDAGAPDAGATNGTPDAGIPDAGTPDAGTVPMDAGGPIDAGAAPTLTKIFLVHVQPPNDAHYAVFTIMGYWGDQVITWNQWGPGFTNIATGATWTDMITNNEFPGLGRFPVGVLLDHHGCCNEMAVHGGQLIVLNNGQGEISYPGELVVYDLDPPAFSDARPSVDGGEWTGGTGPQTTDPYGHTWRVGIENVTFTPSYRGDFYLYRDDYDAG